MVKLTQTPFDLAFNRVLENYGRLQILKSTIESSYERDKYVRLESQKNSNHKFSSSHSMFYREIQTNTCIFYDFQERNIEQLNADTISLLNKQYQWVLVEVFERFVEFIKDCYHQARHVCPTLPEAKHKKGLAGLLECLRAHLPVLNKNETDNYRQMNYRSIIALIEHLRHVVVHNGGVVRNKKNFVAELNKKIQLHNEGKHDQDIIDDLKIFILDSHHGLEINLIKIQNQQMSPMHIDPLANAIEWLLTYSSSLHKQLNIWYNNIVVSNSSPTD